MSHQGILPAPGLCHGFAYPGIIRVIFKYDHAPAIRAARLVTATEIVNSFAEEISAARAMDFNFLSHIKFPAMDRILQSAAKQNLKASGAL